MMIRQQTAIKQLESEMTEIDTEMKLASSSKNRMKDGENGSELKNFMDGQDEYSRLIVSEQEEIQCKLYCMKFFKNSKFYRIFLWFRNFRKFLEI